MKKTRSRESRDTVTLSTLNRFSDPRLFVMNLFTYRYCGKYGTFTSVFKKITSHKNVTKMLEIEVFLNYFAG
jgi:hypothetical protein